MTITSNDIKLYQAQDNTDNDSGGGSRTNIEIVDGDVNNLFPDISRIDTVSGDVALRKVFPTVNTNNNDVYYGAHAIIRKPPADPKVSALIFHTDDPVDKRISAQDKIESYVVASYKEEFWLYGNHVIGAKACTFLQNIESPIPNVGEVYLLKEGDDEQYIRVASIDVQEVSITFSYGGTPNQYPRRRIICEIDQPLEFAFNGSVFDPSGQVGNSADTWATQVADAAKFYATKSLLLDAVSDETVIKVDSIFEQLVPASKKQTPLIDKYALVQGGSFIGTGDLVSEVYTTSSGAPFTVSSAIVPNSISHLHTSTYQDDGLGNIINTLNNNAIVGSVDYTTGTITQTFINGAVSISYEKAITINTDIQYTGEIKITQENVGNVFIQRLSPLPSIGNLYVDYRSNGKWYRFASTGNRDGGNETLGGDANIGAGSLDDNTDGTGTVNVTLASTPDIDSSVIISWGSGEKFSQRTTLVADETQAAMIVDLGQTNINPLSFVMQVYTDINADYRNITALADGTLVDTTTSGKVKGTLDFINGIVSIRGFDGDSSNRFRDLDDTNNVIIDFDYSTVTGATVGAIKEAVVDPDPTGNELPFLSGSINTDFSFELGESVVQDGLRIHMQTKNPYSASGQPFVLESDSLGVLRRWGRNKDSTATYGSVSAAGVVNIVMPTYSAQQLKAGYTLTGSFGVNSRYETVNKTMTLHPLSAGGHVRVEYQTGNPSSFPNSHNITAKYETFSTYEIITLPNIAGEVTLEFLDSGNHIKSKDGLMYDDNDLEIGVINYESGVISLSCFHKPSRLFVLFTTLFTDEIGDEADGKVYNFTFRTAATKLTTSSFNLSYETANGNYIATSDGNGVVTGTDIDSVESYVDTLTGMANIAFTEQTVASSIKYDAVAESSLPLDPELLGLNPVRLPSDGRVPVFKAGYHLVIFNEETTDTTNATPAANDVETLSRNNQALIEVIDVNGKRLDPTQYVADRVTGTVTFADPLTLEDKYANALSAPFSIVDRVEDMVLATDVQINGLITLSAGLSRDYSLGVTKVASALVWGDTGSRTYNLFTQEIWDSGNPVWDDSRIGDNTTAQYDDINNPIQIDNESSTAGRWAVIFKSSTSVDVVHEKLGVVQSNVAITIDDVAPLNPATGAPYFTMVKEGFGAGWITNNVIRFNTDSGDNNSWVIRTVQSGALSELTDSIDIEVRGDAN